MPADLTLSNPTQLRLEFTAADRDRAWRHSQSFTRAGDRWNAYLNRLCLNTMLPWLQEERELQPKVWTNTYALPGFWGLINGTALTLKTAERLVLLPTETIDRDEWRIPKSG